MGKRIRVALISRTSGGHRGELETLIQSLIDDAGGVASIQRDWRAALLHKGPSFFLMIEDGFVGYLVSGLLRAALGRRTVGLMFRGRQTLYPATARRAFRRGFLLLMKATPEIRTLSVTPFSDDGQLATIADDWIYDPQLWDLVGKSCADEPTELSDDVSRRAAGRSIVVALGNQTGGKGFAEFVELWVNHPEVRARYLFVSAGGVAAPLKPTAERASAYGALIVDRFISPAEWLSLYKVANMIWACYAPNYDQASGVVGRALQLGVPVAIRRGAQIAARIEAAGASPLKLDWADQAGWAAALLSFQGRRQAHDAAAMMTTSVRRLLIHLGLPDQDSARPDKA